MAKLVLTKAEKKSEFYLDWSDESLGKAVRQLAYEVTHEKGENGQVNALFLMTCLKIWGTIMRSTNAATMKTSCLLSGDKWKGKWRIEVKASLKKQNG